MHRARGGGAVTDGADDAEAALERAAGSELVVDVGGVGLRAVDAQAGTPRKAPACSLILRRGARERPLLLRHADDESFACTARVGKHRRKRNEELRHGSRLQAALDVGELGQLRRRERIRRSRHRGVDT